MAEESRDLVFMRILDAPRELVYEVWTNPEHLSKWWGPAGFTTTTRAMEFSVGGVWDYVMHGPDGTDYPNKGVFLEIVRPERLVLSNVGGRAEDPHLTCEMTVTFDERGDKTELTLRMRFADAEACEHARKNGASEGGEQSMTCLAEYLAATIATKENP